MAELHPLLLSKLAKVLTAMQALGFPMKVTAGVRTVAQQQALYAKGRTAPGRIVTNADGVRVKSNHQTHDDGYGHAADCAFQGPDPFGETQPWAAYGACAKAVGLEWGGDWVSLRDRPHVQLP